MFNKLFSKSSKTPSVSHRSMMENLENRTMMSAAPAVMHGDALRHEAATVVSLTHGHGAEARHAVRSGLTAGTTGSRTTVSAAHATGAEPLVTENGLHEVNFSNYPLFSSGGPSRNDINQGAVGDCYFLSAIGEEASKNPGRIESLVRARSDGTFDVYFYNNGWVDEHVDGYLPVNASGQLAYANLGQGNSIWAAIMEKGFCYFRAAQRGQTPGYNVIDNTYDDTEVLKDMGLGTLDVAGSAFSSGSKLESYLAQELNAGYDVLLGTNASTSPLIHNHCYAVVGAEVYSGTYYIEVHNPWGKLSPGGAPYSWVAANSLLAQLGQVAISTI